MANGMVVDHKESGVRYAISAHNFREKIHTFVRDLLPGETVVGFQPKPKGALVEEPGLPATPDPATLGGDFVGQAVAKPGPTATTETEGSSTEGTKEAK